jgi:hypothetical protein
MVGTSSPITVLELGWGETKNRVIELRVVESPKCNNYISILPLLEGL